MKKFVTLFNTIDQTNKTSEKVDALVQYFETVNDEDKLWTLAIFTGRNPKRIVTTTQLKIWAAEAAQIPYWLFEESYQMVGDLSETMASIIKQQTVSTVEYSLTEWIGKLLKMKNEPDEVKATFIKNAWFSFSTDERFVFNKLSSGAFRMGVSQKLITRALAKSLHTDENKIAHRLMGNWSATSTTFEQLILSTSDTDDVSKPYPFYLAYPLEKTFEETESIQNWIAEYKWDGIRSQLIVRNDEMFLWSRGEELINEQFPELQTLAKILPNGTVIDGELLLLDDNKIGSFQLLQTRIGRKKPSAKLIQKNPAVIIAYDLLEWEGKDIRTLPLTERRNLLAKLLAITPTLYLQFSKSLNFNSWDQLIELRLQSRINNSEGLMLKQKYSAYEVGRKKGNWWKWKVDPMTVDAVLIYAMSGSGRRANLYTDYTFAVWDNTNQLVPFAKAYSGLTDVEIKEVDTWIRKNTIDKFGPVRSVNAQLVFELGFEDINFSSRHKSGIAVRFPRILRWRKDKKIEEADTLEQLKKLIR